MASSKEPIILHDVRDALAGHGLILRGGFQPEPRDGAPPGTGTVLLVGNAGPQMWRAFEATRPDGRDPLNSWTVTVLTDVADRFGARAIFPFVGPPYAPFITWAKLAEPVFESPLGMLIHPTFGLWHAWRGALAFPEPLELPALEPAPNPCETCSDRPCLTSCPVKAFTGDRYDVSTCATHLRTPQGTDCLAEGCRARRACPIGQDYRYEPLQAALHMTAFLRERPD